MAGAFGGFFTGWEVESAIRTHTEGWIGDGTLEYTVASVFGCCACATTLVGCLEWKWRREHDINKLQLLNGYSGKVREAECTVPADKERILGELEGYENDVENAIRVLLDNGISTPALRKAAKLSGKIAHAGHVNWSMLVLVLSLLLMYPTWNLAHDLELYLTGNFHPCSRCPIELEPLWLPCVDIVMVMVWVGVFWSSHADKRGFAARVMIRMTLWCTVFVKIVPEYWFWTRYIEYRTGYLMYTLGVMPLTFAMTLAGPGRTAHTPLIGPYLVQALMSNPRCLDQHLTNPLQFSSRSLRRLAV